MADERAAVSVCFDGRQRNAVDHKLAGTLVPVLELYLRQLVQLLLYQQATHQLRGIWRPLTAATIAEGHPGIHGIGQSGKVDMPIKPLQGIIQPLTLGWCLALANRLIMTASGIQPRSGAQVARTGEVFRDCRLASFLCRKRYGPEASSSITGVWALLLALNCRASRADEARKVQLSAAEAVFVLAIQSRRA